LQVPVVSALEERIRTVSGTLGDGALAATAADTGTVDNVTLLGLVTETTGLIGARRARGTVDGVELAELYYALSAKFNECIARHMNPRRVFLRATIIPAE
jgi:hypothetical protein